MAHGKASFSRYVIELAVLDVPRMLFIGVKKMERTIRRAGRWRGGRYPGGGGTGVKVRSQFGVSARSCS